MISFIRMNTKTLYVSDSSSILGHQEMASYIIYKKMIVPAVEGGGVLRLYLDKPNHPQQRYCLSEKELKLV